LLKNFRGFNTNVDDHKINSIFICKTFQPSNACNLKTHEMVKKMFKDFHGTLQDFEKANFLELHNAFILKTCEEVEKMSKDIAKSCKISTRLMFSN